MPGGLVERRVDDRVFDDDLSHDLLLVQMCPPLKLFVPELSAGNLGFDSDCRVLQIKDLEFRKSFWFSDRCRDFHR